MKHGIDISKWQPPEKIDYEKLTAGQDFVICRAAYGARSDRHFRTHVKRLRRQHTLLGAYTFLRQSQDWEAQLESFVGELEAVGYGRGDLLPVVDIEWNTKFDGPVDKRRLNPIAKNVLEELTERYGGALVYLAPGFFQTLGKPDYLLGYDWWVAHWTLSAFPWVPWREQLPHGDWSIWQYTNVGRVDGYDGDLDLNRAQHLPVIETDVPGDTDTHFPPNLHENPLAWDLDNDGTIEKEEIAAWLDQAARRVRELP